MARFRNFVPAQPASPHEPADRSVIGRPAPPAIPHHTLHRRIGQGSYGEVWLAADAMGKWRAVKVVARGPKGGHDHGYEREFKAVQCYEEICHSHGSLMPILAVGRDETDRFFYYSMELADDARTNERLDVTASTPEAQTARFGRWRRSPFTRRD